MCNYVTSSCECFEFRAVVDCEKASGGAVFECVCVGVCVVRVRVRVCGLSGCDKPSCRHLSWLTSIRNVAQQVA